jgi:hypothetical protein
MSKISEQLVKYAEEEKAAHSVYVRDFTATSIALLTQGGVDRDKAIFLAKEACFRKPELVESINKANILEKVAQYIEAIEDENVKLAAKLETQTPEQKPVEMSDHMKKLAALGFDTEELEAMKDVPNKVLEKVARAAESADDYGLGRGVGPKVAQMDPFLEFLMK